MKYISRIPTIYLLLLGLCFGVLFRLFFIRLEPQPFVFDQTEYHAFALAILNKGLDAETARLYGYPLFLALIYRICGLGNFAAVYCCQAVIDSLTALLIYLIARKIDLKPQIAYLAFGLYLINPFTSAYVGVLLTEVLGIFLVTLELFVLTCFFRTNKIFWFLISAFVLGIVPQVRPVFQIGNELVLVICLWQLWRQSVKSKILITFISLVLFFLGFVYTLVGNWVTFSQFTPFNVDNIPVRELFISLNVTGRAPYHIRSIYGVYPEAVMVLYMEYSSPRTTVARKQIAQKYWNKSLAIIQTKPLDFILTRFEKAWFVWEKHYLFYYRETPNSIRDVLVYWGNMVLIILGISGLIGWVNAQFKSKHKYLTSVGILYIFIIIYISGMHTISLAEERYSLPGYPILILFASFSLVKIMERFVSFINECGDPYCRRR